MPGQQSGQGRYREVLLLSEVEEMSYQEIATALAIPVGTVMSRLSRAPGLARGGAAEAAQEFTMTEDRTEKTPHEWWTGKLDAYLDGELDSGQMQELDRHLRECSGCTAEALRRRQWKRAIHSAGQCYVPDPALGERICRSISPAKPAWRHWRPAFALTAAVLLLLIGARSVQREMVQPGARLIQETLVQQSRIAGELADLHVATLASTNPVDVVSSDRHNVKPWFAGKIPFSFDLPEMQGSQFELVGGRVSYLEQSPGAQR